MANKPTIMGIVRIRPDFDSMDNSSFFKSGTRTWMDMYIFALSQF